MGLQFGDLILQAAAVRLMFLCVDWFLLERSVFLPERIHFPSQLFMLRVEIVAFATRDCLTSDAS